MVIDGAPDRIRTCGLCLRRAALYPAELRVLTAVRLAKAAARRQSFPATPCYGLFTRQRDRLELAKATACPALERAGIQHSDDIAGAKLAQAGFVAKALFKPQAGA